MYVLTYNSDYIAKCVKEYILLYCDKIKDLMKGDEGDEEFVII